MKTCRNHLLAVLRGAVCASALVCAWGGLEAGTVFVDFATTTGGTGDGATSPDGWTYSSIGKSDGAAYFNAGADFMVSPAFEACVTNVVLEYKCSATNNVPKFLRVVPLKVAEAGTMTNETAAVVCTNTVLAKTKWSVPFDPELCANAFLIGMEGSGNTGNWTLYSATIAHMGPDAPVPLGVPTGIQAENVTSNAFTLSWNSVAGATGYGIHVWQESEAPPTGTASLYERDFSGLANTSGNPRDVAGSLADVFGAGWCGEVIYLPARTSGHVQIGKKDTLGWLLSSALGDPGSAAYTLAVRAKRHLANEEGTVMPVDLVRGSTTNVLVSFRLGDDWAWHTAPLTDLVEGDRLLFHSLTNGRGKRALISSVQVLADYAPGVVTTNEILNLEGWGTTSKDIDHLVAGESYRYAVGAEREDERSGWSVPGVVALAEAEEDDPVVEEGTAPTGLEAMHVTSNSFTVSWNAVAGATEYLVTVVTNVVVPEREGKGLWGETFANVPQMSSGEWPVEQLRRWTDWPSWDGTNIFAYATTEPVVQLGRSENRGTLSTGPLGLDGAGRVLKFRAWRNEGRSMPFEVIDDMGRTNLAIDVALGTMPETYRIELPELSSGDGLVFHSTTNAQRGRVYLGEMRILADGEPEWTNALHVAENLPTTDLSMSFDGLLPTIAQVRVAAVVAGTTNVSDVLAVDMSNPLSGVWRVSQFVGGVKEELFGWVTNVLQSTSWVNGETIPGFHALMNGGELDAIGFNSGKAKNAGIYSSSTNVDDISVQSLSLLASGEREVVVELRIVNDSPTRKTVSGATLDFMAHQWTFPDAGERTLSAEWAVTDGTRWPCEGDWNLGTNFNSVATLEEGVTHRAVPQVVRTGRIRVPVGGRLCFRWRAAKATGSPMFGMSDVRVRLEFLKDPSFVIFR